MVLVAWLHDVQQLIGLNVLQPKPLLRTETPVDSSAAARELALWVRAELEEGSEPVESLMELCERAGQYVLVTELPGDGASVVDGNVAAAVVSIQGEPGRRRATAAHELGHLVIGDEYSNDLGVHASRADREAVLDAFAAEFLLPTQVLTETAQADGITRDQLIELAARYRTSWSLAIRQADHAGVLTEEARREWSRSTPTRAEFMEAVGWVPQPDLESIRVPPGYAHAVVEAWKQRPCHSHEGSRADARTDNSGRSAGRR